MCIWKCGFTNDCDIILRLGISFVMPRIDPQQLLSCLAVLLNPNGGIRSKEEVVRLASLMTKYSKNLVSKCVYILILKNTDTELLGRFMSAGGWNLTHLWLTNGIMNKNWALVGELLELMLMCPVDVERLKANNCPKLVKGLSKEGGPEDVRVLASKLVEQWLKVVKGETQGNTISVATSQQAILQQAVSQQVVSQQAVSIVPPPPVQQDLTVKEPLTDMVEATSCPAGSTQSPDQDPRTETSPSEEEQRVTGTQPTTIYRLTVRDGKQVIAKVEDPSTPKIESLDATQTAAAKSEKERSSSSSSRDKDRSKHSSSKHSSSSKSSSSSRKSSTGGSSSSSSSHKDKSRERDKDRDHRSSSSKNKDKDKDRDKLKNKLNGASGKSSGNSSSSSSSSSKDNKEKQAEKDKATLAKIQPQSISKIGRIPKKASSDDDKKDKKHISSTPVKSSSESKKASISIVNRKHDPDTRPKIKVFNAKMRSTGLEEEAKPPPPRPLPRKIPPPKRVSPPKDTVKDIIPHPPEKKAKIVDVMLNGDLERPGGIKLIAPKPKPAGLQECGMFMDAMVAASTKKEPKKRKRRMSGGKEEGPGGKSSSPPNSPSISSPSTINSPVSLKPTAPKFYKETLETDEDIDAKSESKADVSSDAKSDENRDEMSELKPDTDDRSANVGKSSDVKLEGSMSDSQSKSEDKIPGGVLVYHKRKGPKKVVKWKVDAELEEIQYFELDETERVNVTKTFTDMKQMEMSGEREALIMSRKLPNEDLMDERTRWRALIPLDLTPDLAVRGKNSKEKDIQYAREKVILQALYFHRSMIPDSPTEPDVEHHQMEDPTVIPMDDVAGNPDNVKDFTGTPWPESKGEMPRPQLPPPVPPFANMQPPFMGGPPGAGPFPPFPGPANFMPERIMGGDWRTGDGRVMGMPADVPMPPPNMFNPMAGIPPNMFPGPTPDGFMPPNMNMNTMNNMNGPPFPPADFSGGPGPMYNDSGFQGNRGGGGGGNMRGRNRNVFDNRFNNGPNNWKGGRNWSNRGICKHFQKGGFCRQGDKCQFLHPGVNCPPF